MSIARTVDLVVAAKEAGYAVPAVNIVDDLSLRAVVTAAVKATVTEHMHQLGSAGAAKTAVSA
jgi:fructose/tagatose bisphosphate aldolase